MSIPKEKIPRHIAFILDGNRRFAKKLALQPWKGHEFGKKKVEDLLDWCKEFEIHEITLYAFSLQNFARAKDEVNFLMNLFVDACADFANRSLDDREKLRIRVVGRKDLLPKKVQDAILELENKTKDNTPFTLNVAMAYGGREEVVDAVKELAREVKSGSLDPDAISIEKITDHLQVCSEPDLIVRTSGEQRTSNFLIWQSWYSEWIFLKKFWPEFSRDDFVACLEEYASRDRRFGGK